MELHKPRVFSRPHGIFATTRSLFPQQSSHKLVVSLPVVVFVVGVERWEDERGQVETEAVVAGMVVVGSLQH